MDGICTLHRGSAPLLISLPHDGSAIPAALAERMTPEARRAPDTDWHVSRLYAFARELGASILVPEHSRYVIDLNRGEDDTSLYPGQNTTGLVPLVRFNGAPVFPSLAIPAVEVSACARSCSSPSWSAASGDVAFARTGAAEASTAARASSAAQSEAETTRVMA